MISLLIDGEEGFQRVLRRFTARHHWALWLVMLVPWMAGATLFAVWRSMDGKDYAFVPTDLLQYVVPGVTAGVTAAIAEEIGWRGFLLPRLMTYMGAFRASLVVGFVSTLWHAAPFVLGVPGVGRAAGALLLPVSAFSLIPISLVQTWLHVKGRGSLALAVGYTVSSTAAFHVFHAPLHVGTDESRVYFSFWELVLANLFALPFYLMLQAAYNRRRRLVESQEGEREPVTASSTAEKNE